MGMDDLKQQAMDLQAEAEAAAERIDVDAMVERKLRLEAKPDLSPTERAALRKLNANCHPWLVLQEAIEELLENIDAYDNDETHRPEISSDLTDLTQRLGQLQKETGQC